MQNVNPIDPNSLLDPQDSISALAHMTPEDMAEYNEWLAMVDARNDERATCQH